MSTHVVAARPARSSHGAAALLAHAATPLLRYVAAALGLALGCASALMFWLGDPSERTSAGVFLAVAGVAVVWGVWFSRLLLLHVEARQGLVPELQRELAGAGALAFVVSVAVPSLFLVAAGVPPWMALCALAAAACTGVLLAMLPRIMYLVLCLAPAMLVVLGSLLDLVFPAGLAVLRWRPSLVDVAWALPLLLAATAWRWRAIVDRGVEHLSPWWQPTLLSGAKPGADWGWYSGGKLNAQMPDLFWPAGQTAGAGPGNPVRSVRALLGTPFAPLSRVQIAVQVGMVAAAFGYVAAVGFMDGTDLSLLAGAGIGAAAVMVLMFGQRLEALYVRRSTELDELALLPGLGTPALQRSHLLRAVLLPPSILAAALAMLLAAVIFLVGLSPAAALMLLLSAAGIVQVTLLACLRPIAGLRMNGWRMLLLAGPVALLAFAGTIYATSLEGEPGIGLLLLALPWIPAFLVLGTMTVATLRRFRRRPHPFLSY